jgi:glycosyltransferase involved in cell wall biosynthesis
MTDGGIAVPDDHGTRPLVSCIVPAHNSAAFIGDALDSILAQTHRPLEIIVVDAGSTDATATIAGRPIAGRHASDIRVLEVGDRSPAIARNAGLGAATGEFVAFLDADDLWLPAKTERQLRFMSENPQFDASITLAQNFWPAALSDEESSFDGHRRAQPIAGYASITLLARRTFFDRVGRFREDLWHSDSTEWFIRIGEREEAIGLVSEVLVRRRMHETNLSRRLAGRARGEFLDLIKQSRDRRKQDGGIRPLAGLPGKR